jgi:hypothetical protein
MLTGADIYRLTFTFQISSNFFWFFAGSRLFSKAKIQTGSNVDMVRMRFEYKPTGTYLFGITASALCISNMFAGGGHACRYCFTGYFTTSQSGHVKYEY